MFSKKSNGNGTGKIDTIIGALIEVKGNINAKASIRIDGIIEGNIESKEEVILGKDGKIKGDIKAKVIFIGGKVEGNINANEKVEILSSGQLIGDVIAPRVIIEEGAVFTGTSRMSSNSSEKPVGVSNQI